MKGKKALYLKIFISWLIVTTLESVSYYSMSAQGTFFSDLFTAVGTANLCLMVGFLIAPVFFRFFILKRPVRKPIWNALIFIASMVAISRVYIQQMNEPLYFGWLTVVLFFYAHLEVMMYEKAEVVEAEQKEA